MPQSHWSTKEIRQRGTEREKKEISVDFVGLWIEKNMEKGSINRLSAASWIYKVFISISDSKVLIILEKFKKMLY